jgi:hypothetical protein
MFQILTVHTDSVESLNDLDEKLKPIVRGPWNGRKLPFPILLDGTGETKKNFGISYYPTTVIIDPDGNVVEAGSVEWLEDKLNKLEGRGG